MTQGQMQAASGRPSLGRKRRRLCVKPEGAEHFPLFKKHLFKAKPRAFKIGLAFFFFCVS